MKRWVRFGCRIPLSGQSEGMTVGFDFEDEVDSLRESLSQREDTHQRYVEMLCEFVSRLSTHRQQQPSLVEGKPAVAEKYQSAAYTAAEVAARRRVSVGHVHRLKRQRKIRRLHISRKVCRFTEEHIQEFVKSLTIPFPKSVDRKQSKRLPSASVPSKGGETLSGELLRAQLREEMRSW